MGLRTAMPVTVLAVWALTLLAPVSSSAQDASEEWLALLERVMPEGDRFTDRQGQPSVFEAYRVDPSTGQETLAGYAFLTSDLPPEQMGFNGPIEVLVGMDLGGVLTGIVVVRYNESLQASRGDFLARDGFQEQFSGKSIVDAFQVRRDVDGISGATITVDAMSRGIRNAAREVAVAYRLGSVSSDAESPPLDPVSVTLDEFERLSWTQMLFRGLVQQILVLNEERTAADLTLIYVRDEAVAELLIGSDMLGEVLERAGPLTQERHLILAGVDGPSAGSLNLGRLSVVQNGDTLGLAPPGVLLFGPARAGKLDGQVRMLRALLLDPAVDMTQPFTFILDLRPRLGLFSADYPGERRLAVDEQEDEQETVLSRRFTGTSRGVGPILALLSIVFIVTVTVRLRRQRSGR